MDTERQHELAENDLAGTTLELVDRIRPHLRTIVAGIALLFAGLAAWTVISAQQSSAKARSWKECIAALSSGDAEGLAAVATQKTDSSAAGWAQLVLADSALAQGCDLLFADRARGLERLQDAVGRYRQLLASRPTGMLAERTVFGLAKANEALGNLDEARQGYQAVIADHPGSAAASLAASRVGAVSPRRDSRRQARRCSPRRRCRRARRPCGRKVIGSIPLPMPLPARNSPSPSMPTQPVRGWTCSSPGRFPTAAGRSSPARSRKEPSASTVSLLGRP
jgi:predicted negative regulator of RcsB-dependent stress response